MERKNYDNPWLSIRSWLPWNKWCKIELIYVKLQLVYDSTLAMLDQSGMIGNSSYFLLLFQVILFGHSPPGKYERSGQLFSTAGERRRHEGQHWLQDKFNRKYLQFIRRYSDIIVGQFFGHQHTDTFRIFKDGAGKI